MGDHRVKRSDGGTIKGLVVMAMAVVMVGCSAGRALNKQAEKDYDVLTVGTDRDLVRAELGQPLASVNAGDCDLFSFEEGSGGLKYLRAAGYSLLAIGTLGISEIITNPVEAAVGNDKVRIRVCYDQVQHVSYAELLRVGKPAKLMSGEYPKEPLKLAAPAAAPPAPVAVPVVVPVVAPVVAPVDAAAVVEAAATAAAVAEPEAAPAPAPADESTAAIESVEASLVEATPPAEQAAAPAAAASVSETAPAPATPAN